MPSLQFTIQRQLMPNWCWAAVATSVFKFYRPQSPISQRRFVSDFLHLPQCDAGIPAPTCNRQASLSEALFKLNIFNGRIDNHVPPSEIEREIGMGRPVCSLLLHPQFSGHFVVISGIFRSEANPGIISVRVEDPVNAMEHIVPYPDLINGFLGSNWVKTFFTKPLPVQA